MTSAFVKRSFLLPTALGAGAALPKTRLKLAAPPCARSLGWTCAKLSRAVLVRSHTEHRHHDMGFANTTQGPGRFAGRSTSSTTLRVRRSRSFSGRGLCRQGSDRPAVSFKDNRRDDRFWSPEPCCFRSAGPSTRHAHSNSNRWRDRRGCIVAGSRDSRGPITSAPGIVLSAVREPPGGRFGERGWCGNRGRQDRPMSLRCLVTGSRRPALRARARRDLPVSSPSRPASIALKRIFLQRAAASARSVRVTSIFFLSKERHVG